MKLSIHLLLIATLVGGTIQAQNIGINTSGVTPAASAMLDIAATDRGLLIPRMALTSRLTAAPVVTPATSLVVYNTANAGAAPNNVTAGFYYWSGTEWLRMFSGKDAWTTTGNYGTVAGTNFIGTADAIDFVVKTGGIAAVNERMRVLSGGQVVLNKATPVAGDVFSVYANNRGGLNNTVGAFAINGYTVDGFGIFGDASNATGIGALGSNTSITGGAVGVQGEVASRNGRGVIGLANYGAYAIPNGTNAIGVQGLVNGTLAATGQAIGVYGSTATTMTTGDANGVWGQTSSNNGTGIVGLATSTAAGGQPEGVYGAANNATGFGMDARNGNGTGTGLIATGNNVAGTYLVGGSGAAFNGSTIGAFSIARTAASGSGLVGVGNNGIILTPAVGCGVVGTGKQYGVVGFATTMVNTNLNNNSAANLTNASSGGYFEVQSGGTAQTWAYVGVRDNTSVLRKIIGPGTVNTIVKDLQDNLVALSCPEAPENLFQDYGAGQLQNGKAHIQLDPILAKNIVVNEHHPLRVFVQLEGDCNGVYVTNKTGNSFDVAELANGTSNTSFTYTVVANRADEVLPDGSISRYSAERFAPAPGPVEKQAMESRPVEKRDLMMERAEKDTVPAALAPKRTK